MNSDQSSNGRRDKVRFCIFFPERSGSTWLTTLLNSHKDIVCERELFYITKNGDKSISRPEKTDTKEKALSLINYLYEEQKKPFLKVFNYNLLYKKANAVGFKFKYPKQFREYTEIHDYISKVKDDLRVVFLYRQNLLKKVISRINMNSLKETGTGRANVFIKEFPGFTSMPKIRLDVAEVIAEMEDLMADDVKYCDIASHYEHKMLITYEDLYYSHEETVDRVVSFLGLPKRKLKVRTHKITSDNLEDAVENYDELKSALKGTKFEVFLGNDYKSYPRLAFKQRIM